MINDKREYHFKGKIKISKSKFLEEHTVPKDDDVNWLFAKIDNHRYGFIYKIIAPEKASYNNFFQILLSFLMVEEVKEKVVFGEEIKLDRGEENIGKLIIENSINI